MKTEKMTSAHTLRDLVAYLNSHVVGEIPPSAGVAEDLDAPLPPGLANYLFVAVAERRQRDLAERRKSYDSKPLESLAGELVEGRASTEEERREMLRSLLWRCGATESEAIHYAGLA
jgi:hypothetical protein